MTTTTPNMNLILPDVGITTGPQWATLIDAAYTLIDSHDHSSGQGVRITPSGLNISSDLTFAQHNATNLRTARLYNNSSISLGVSDKTCLYSLNDELYYVDGAGNNVQVTISGALNISTSITALTLKDTGFFLEYFGDVTKKVRFDVASIPTGTTRIMSIPDSGMNDTLVTTGATQTLSAKTLTSSVLSGNTATNLISGSGTLTLNTTGTQTLQNATDTIVSRATTDTLTNKILTGNTIASFTPNGGTNTITVPAVTDTLVGLAASQTLTNKVLTGNTAVNLISGSATVTLPTTTGTLATLANVETLSNKSITGPLKILADTTVQFNNSANSFSTSLKAGANIADLTLSLPIADGMSGQALVTDGSGVLSFSSASGAAATTTTPGTITKEGVWTAYTPTFSVGYGSVSNIAMFYKVLGDSLFIRGVFKTGTVAGSIGTITLPGGFVINTSKIPTGGGQVIFGLAARIGQAAGTGILQNNNATAYTYDGSSTGLVQLVRDTDSSGVTSTGFDLTVTPAGLLGSNTLQTIIMLEIPI